MASYVKSTDFAAKDALLTGNPAKIIKGTEIDTEYNAIAVAIGTKADLASPTFTGTPAAPTASPGTNTTQVATTAFVTVADTAAITAERSATATLTNKTLTSPTINGGTITGITDLTVEDGGTGVSSLTADNVILGDGTNPVKFVAPGTSGNALVSNGSTWISGSPDKLSTASGSAPSYSARAWVNFDGTFATSPFTVANGGIRAAGNVSSITDNQTGDYTVNFTNSLTDENYAISIMSEVSEGAAQNSPNVPNIYTRAASSLRIMTLDSSANRVDHPLICIALFR